tara:strand:- start:1631 stop:1867 length:237 start_codon:yes stop_codon:yes gene_type:complete
MTHRVAGNGLSVLPDSQELAGAMGRVSPQPMLGNKSASTTAVNPLIRFGQKTSGRAEKAAQSFGQTSLMNRISDKAYS